MSYSYHPQPFELSRSPQYIKSLLSSKIGILKILINLGNRISR
jgi:hypothetical protein